MPEATSKSTDLAVVSGSAMTPVEQAAIVLLSMGEEPAAAVLRCLSREELLEVTQVMSRMSGIKVEAVKTAMQRFFDDYREQSGMQAVFLAFLPPALAGSVIDALPAEGRDLVLLNVARLNEIDHELLMELEELVARCLGSLGNQSANVEGIRQAAEILNRLPGDREQIVELLRAHDPNVVSEIELRMYDFFILSRQSEAVLQRIIEAVPIEQWALALKGAEPAIRNAVLQSMPRRQAQGFEDTMRRSGPVPISRIEQARAEIMAEVKALADAGEIEVQLFAEATVE